MVLTLDEAMKRTPAEVARIQKSISDERERRNRSRQAEMDACPHICAEIVGDGDEMDDYLDPTGEKRMQCPCCGKGFYFGYVPCDIH